MSWLRVPPIPRRSVRLRLTALYGGLFLACGAGLLALTYALVDRATAVDVPFKLPGGGTGALMSAPGGASFAVAQGGVGGSALTLPPGLSPTQARIQAHNLLTLAQHQHGRDLHLLLMYSLVGLAVMAAASIVLGWVIAGRVLGPLRTITTAAREISATNLSRRLALTGADDELKELGDTFDGLLARLETAFAAQRQFVANASHELRSPLTRQQALIQVALADPEASVGSLRAAHERVLVSGHQQQRLIDALLALARGQAGLHQAETVDLSAVVAQVLALRESELQARGVAVHSNLSSAFVVGDRRLLEQLVTNIVDNAAHHNNADGQLMVATAVGQDRCVLTVSNTGPVVPAEEVARLLRPFQRMGAERTGPGLGLGLSIVEAIAMAHGADLAVLPRPTGGLHVSVSFVRFAQPRSTGTRALAAATT